MSDTFAHVAETTPTAHGPDPSSIRAGAAGSAA